MKIAIWMSYDLGVRGDYEGMFTWLDEHGALECSDNLAFIKYEFSGDFDLIKALKKDLKDSVDITKRTRIYVIRGDNNIKGTFLFGTRKAAPWAGYTRGKEEVIDEGD